MDDLHKIEAVLFGAGRFLSTEEISAMSKIEFENVEEHLKNLQSEYEARSTSLRIVEEGKSWKMNVRDDFLPLIQGVVTSTEFDKPLMETLAVIAWRYPALQSDIIRIRHNKAYEHLSQLESIGFINRNKHGRSKKINLTQKFFDYFDLPSKEQAQEAFRESLPEDVKKAIEETERQIMETEKVIEDTKSEKDKQQQEENEKSKNDDKIDEKENIVQAIEKVGNLEGYEDGKEVDLVDDTGKEVELDQYDSNGDVEDYGDNPDNSYNNEIEDTIVTETDEDNEETEDETPDSNEEDKSEDSEDSDENSGQEPAEDESESQETREEVMVEESEQTNIGESNNPSEEESESQEQENVHPDVQARMEQIKKMKAQIDQTEENSKDEFEEDSDDSESKDATS